MYNTQKTQILTRKSCFLCKSQSASYEPVSEEPPTKLSVERTFAYLTINSIICSKTPTLGFEPRIPYGTGCHGLLRAVQDRRNTRLCDVGTADDADQKRFVSAYATLASSHYRTMNTPPLFKAKGKRQTKRL